MKILSKYILLEDTSKGTDHSDMMVGNPSGFSFIAVHIPATADSDSIDYKTKGNDSNIAKPHEIQALIRQPSTWSCDTL